MYSVYVLIKDKYFDSLYILKIHKTRKEALSAENILIEYYKECHL